MFLVLGKERVNRLQAFPLSERKYRLHGSRQEQVKPKVPKF
jgi:hypothetical protein